MCKAKNMDKALGFYSDMKKKGIGLDDSIFNSLLDGFIKTDYDIDKSEKIIQEILCVNLRPNDLTINLIVQILIKNNRIKKSMDILNDIKKKGIIPSPMIYSSLIKGCIDLTKIDHAINFFEEIKELNLRHQKISS